MVCRLGLTSLLSVWAIAGCDAPHEEPAPRAPAAERSPHHEPSAEHEPALAHGEEAASASSRGVVRETMNAGGYTYLRIEAAGSEPVWVAAVEMPVQVGDEVVVEGGHEMVDFHSRTLDRTFDRIVFASSVRVEGEGEATATDGVAAHAGEAAPSGGVRGVVRETMNAGGYTYLHIEGPGLAGGSVWVAAPEMTVAVGDEVEAAAGAEMPGFHSRTLDRTFAQITFSPGARVVTPAAAR
jgi:hypothetical protein